VVVDVAADGNAVTFLFSGGVDRVMLRLSRGQEELAYEVERAGQEAWEGLFDEPGDRDFAVSLDWAIELIGDETAADRVESALLAAARDRMPLHDGIADPAPGVVRRAPAGWKDEVMIGDTRVLLTVDERGCAPTSWSGARARSGASVSPPCAAMTPSTAWAPTLWMPPASPNYSLDNDHKSYGLGGRDIVAALNSNSSWMSGRSSTLTYISG